MVFSNSLRSYVNVMMVDFKRLYLLLFLNSAVFDTFLSCKWFENLLEPIFYLRAITKKNFQLKIPILRKIDCSAIYAHAMMGLIFIWDLLVMCPGAENRFRLYGGIC